MSHIDFRIDNGVGHITLNRENVLNSFNVPMGKEMQSILDECKEDDEVRAIYLTGAGRAFCAGQDLEEAISENAESIDHFVATTYNPILTRIVNIEKPIVCGVNGVAAGAGANMAFACDITFAVSSAKFIQSFINIGLIPDSAGTYTIPRLVGMQRAKAMMYLGNKVMAQEAEEMGLIYKCVPDGELDQAIQLAERLASMPTKGLGLTKRALNLSLNNSFEEQVEIERVLQGEAGNSKDYKEGVNAFLEKRKPEFTGA